MIRKYWLPLLLTACALTPLFFSCSKHSPAKPGTDTTAIPIDTTPVVIVKADSNQTLYFGSMGGGLYAVNALTGTLLWKFPTDGPVFSSPTVANGMVYFGCGNFHMYAVDAKTGALQWEHAIVYPVSSSPVVSGNRLYFGGNDMNIYSLNALTGEQIWNFPMEGRSNGGESIGRGVVYASSDGGHTYALDSATGTVLWKNDSGTVATIRLANKLVYQSTIQGDLQAIDLTGKTVWDVPVGNIGNLSPVYHNGVIYTVTASDALIGLDALTGAHVWAAASGLAVSPSFVDSGMIFCGIYPNSLNAYDLTTGAQKWSLTVSFEIATSPVAQNGIVYAASKDGYMYAVDGTTGKQKWSFYDSSTDGIQSSPCLLTANGKVISSTLTGDVQ